MKSGSAHDASLNDSASVGETDSQYCTCTIL